MEYDFVTEDGSKITIGAIPSEGLDSGDKATNKALSAALKYALIQTFSVATKDMEDADKTSPEIAPKSAVQKQEQTGVSAAQIKRLFSIAKASNWTEEDIKAYYKQQFNIESSKQLTQKQYDDACLFIQKTVIAKKEAEGF